MRKIVLAVFILLFLVNLVWAAPKPGEKGPDFSLLSLKGEKVSLSSLKGKVVLVGMFHICVPCMNQAMEFEKVKNALPKDKLAVVGINTSGDSKEKVEKYLAGFPQPISFSYLLDPEHTVHKAYTQRDMPTVLIFDTEGVIRARTPGVDANQLISFLKKLI